MEVGSSTANKRTSDKRNFKRQSSDGREANQSNAGATGIFKLKSCSLCGHPFGLFLSRGYNCRECGLRICKKCKVYEEHTSSWNCIICAKNRGNLKESSSTSTSTQQVKSILKDNSSPVKRSWSISVPNRSSPVLKSYVKFSDEKPQFYSLPRMSSEKSFKPSTNNSEGEPKDDRLEYAHVRNSISNNAIHSLQFQTTLHPFTKTQVRKSPSSSINFIEDEFWDYYDYEVNRSNRSSCERSLGETVEYQQHFVLQTPQLPPKKPDRRKSKSMGSFDTKYSQLKTYCLVSKKDFPNQNRSLTAVHIHNPKDVKDEHKLGASQLYYSSLPRKLLKTSTERNNEENEKENNNNLPNNNNVPTPTPRRRSHNGKFLKKDNDRVHVLGGTLPKNWSLKDRNGKSDSTRNRSASTKAYEPYSLDPQLSFQYSAAKSKYDEPNADWYSSLPPTLNPDKKQRRVTKIALIEPLNLDFDSSVTLKNLPYGNTSCSCESRHCLASSSGNASEYCNTVPPAKTIFNSTSSDILTLPQPTDIKTSGFTNKIVINSGGQTCNIMTSDNNTLKILGNLQEGKVSHTAKPFSCISAKGIEENTALPEKMEDWKHKLMQIKRGYNSINKNVINFSDNKRTQLNREIIIPIEKEFENRERKSGIDKIKNSGQFVKLSRSSDNNSLEKILPTTNKITAKVSTSDRQQPAISISMEKDEPFINMTSQLPLMSRSSSTSSFASDIDYTDGDPFQECNVWYENEDEDTRRLRQDKSLVKDNNGHVAKHDDFKSCEELSGSSDEETNEHSLPYANAVNIGQGEDEDNVPQFLNTVEKELQQQQREAKGVIVEFTTPSSSSSAGDDDAIVRSNGTEGLLTRLSDQRLSSSKNNSQNMIVDKNIVSNCEKINNSNEVMNSNIKKYKSRIIINADNDNQHSSDIDNGAPIKVQIIDGQVGIVTGRGTFLGREEDTNGSTKLNILDNKSSDIAITQPEDQFGHKLFVKTQSVSVSTQQEKQDAGHVNHSYDSEKGFGEKGELSSTISVASHFNKTEKENAAILNDTETKMTAYKLAKLSKPEHKTTEQIGHLINDSLASERLQTQEEGTSNDTPVNNTAIPSCRRESPEGQESQDVKTPDPNPNKHSMARYSPIGADKYEEVDKSSRPKTPILQSKGPASLGEDEEGEDSTDSWTEEISFEEEVKPPPLDLTLHTIVEESCEESDLEPEGSGQDNKESMNELERYYNFTVEDDDETIQYEESEFSDTFSESSLNSELRNSIDVDPADLASERLEKYFMNLGLTNDSDSVGSESESDSSVLENRKKVLKHHRRSAEFEDEQARLSEEEIAFEQEGFDTIKKQRKLRKSTEDLKERAQKAEIIPVSSSYTDPATSGTVTNEMADSFIQPTTQLRLPGRDDKVKPSKPTSVSRSSSFTWSSDEEVNLMMSKLRELVKNAIQNKKVDDSKDEKLVYLESELIRLMRSENISDSDDDVYRLFEKVEQTKQPELLNKLMVHVGERLSTWMRDEDELIDDAATIKCAPSVSSDLNEDRFSWKGSFESTLAKRQSVGSTDSLDYGGVTAMQDDISDRSILRSSSLHHLANSQPILEETSDSLTNSLPRLNNPPLSNINRAKSLFINEEVKSARYRPPGYYFELVEKENHVVSTPMLNEVISETHNEMFEARDLSLQPSNIKVRGQIEFSMQYDYKHSSFEIRIKQCRDLASADTKRGRSDPYVKVYLLPDRTKSSKRKTKTKKNTLNPVFGEVLKFPVSLEELETRNLWLSVWHFDLFGKNEFLGQIVINLKTITFDDTSYRWFTLGDKDAFEETLDNETQTIDLIIALKWSSSKTFAKGDLSVLIKEAKGVKCIKSSYPSTFVKCVPLTEKSKKQKTVLCRKSLNPTWNTTLVFENVSNTGVELSIYKHYDLLNHELLGSVKVDNTFPLWREMLSREKFWVEGVITF